LPSLLVGLFAGVFVDRYDQKIMITADLIRALFPDPVPRSVNLVGSTSSSC
jgi:hypothetical protein